MRFGSYQFGGLRLKDGTLPTGSYQERLEQIFRSKYGKLTLQKIFSPNSNFLVYDKYPKAKKKVISSSFFQKSLNRRSIIQRQSESISGKNRSNLMNILCDNIKKIKSQNSQITQPRYNVLKANKNFIDFNQGQVTLTYNMDSNPVENELNNDNNLLNFKFIQFNSKFENGNLSKATKVSKVEKEKLVIFNILNFRKKNSLFDSGLQISIYSKQHQKKQIGWVKGGDNIAYVPNGVLINPKKSEIECYYTLRFEFMFMYEDDEVSFALSEPYTYRKHQQKMDQIRQMWLMNHCTKHKIIGKSLGGFDIDSLAITNPQQVDGRIVVLARTHPGESVASYIVDGILDFLYMRDNELGKIAKDNFIFKVFPMINPDGVIQGNTRCSLSGLDINRRWGNAVDPKLFPEIHSVQQAIQEFSEQNEIALVLDLHSSFSQKWIYTASFDDQPNSIKSREFPYLLSKLCPNFNFSSCKYFSSNLGGVSDQLEANKLSLMMKELYNVTNIFTVYASIQGIENKNDQNFVRQDYHDFGHVLCKAIILHLHESTDDSQLQAFYKSYKTQLLLQNFVPGQDLFNGILDVNENLYFNKKYLLHKLYQTSEKEQQENMNESRQKSTRRSRRTHRLINLDVSDSQPSVDNFEIEELEELFFEEKEENQEEEAQQAVNKEEDQTIQQQNQNIKKVKSSEILGRSPSPEYSKRSSKRSVVMIGKTGSQTFDRKFTLKREFQSVDYSKNKNGISPQRHSITTSNSPQKAKSQTRLSISNQFYEDIDQTKDSNNINNMSGCINSSNKVKAKTVNIGLNFNQNYQGKNNQQYSHSFNNLSYIEGQDNENIQFYNALKSKTITELNSSGRYMKTSEGVFEGEQGLTQAQFNNLVNCKQKNICQNNHFNSFELRKRKQKIAEELKKCKQCAVIYDNRQEIALPHTNSILVDENDAYKVHCDKCQKLWQKYLKNNQKIDNQNQPYQEQNEDEEERNLDQNQNLKNFYSRKNSYKIGIQLSPGNKKLQDRNIQLLKYVNISPSHIQQVKRSSTLMVSSATSPVKSRRGSQIQNQQQTQMESNFNYSYSNSRNTSPYKKRHSSPTKEGCREMIQKKFCDLNGRSFEIYQSSKNRKRNSSQFNKSEQNSIQQFTQSVLAEIQAQESEKSKELTKMNTKIQNNQLANDNFEEGSNFSPSKIQQNLQKQFDSCQNQIGEAQLKLNKNYSENLYEDPNIINERNIDININQYLNSQYYQKNVIPKLQWDAVNRVQENLTINEIQKSKNNSTSMNNSPYLGKHIIKSNEKQTNQDNQQPERPQFLSQTNSPVKIRQSQFMKNQKFKQSKLINLFSSASKSIRDDDRQTINQLLKQHKTSTLSTNKNKYSPHTLKMTTISVINNSKNDDNEDEQKAYLKQLIHQKINQKKKKDFNNQNNNSYNIDSIQQSNFQIKKSLNARPLSVQKQRQTHF